MCGRFFCLVAATLALGGCYREVVSQVVLTVDDEDRWISVQYLPLGRDEADIETWVLLTHDAGGTQDSFLADTSGFLAAHEMAAARWSLPGHGSVPHGEGYRTDTAWRSFDEDDWRACRDALDEAVNTLRNDMNEDAALFLLGEGYGGLLSLHYAKHNPGIAGVVLISPPAEAHGLKAVPLIENFDQTPVLILCAENDATRMPVAQAMADAAPAFVELRIYPGAARGADLLAAKPNALQQILEWLSIVG